MRVINDKPGSDQKPQTVAWGLLPFYTLVCAMGFSSVFLSPFALILAHRRLPDFWPKVVSIAGALLAVTVLEVPLPMVLLSFVLGVFVADSIQRQISLWKLLARGALLTGVLGVLGVIWASRPVHGIADLWVTWNGWVDQLIAQAQKSPLVAPGWDWAMLRNILVYQGPFYFISGCLLAVWLGIGLAAHLKWQSETDLYSAEKLRTMRLPSWWGFAVAGLWVIAALSEGPVQAVVAGIAYMGMVVLSIQGMIVVSLFLNKKQWRPTFRTVVYGVFALAGFYALVGLGLISPIIFNRKGVLIHTETRNLEEAV